MNQVTREGSPWPEAAHISDPPGDRHRASFHIHDLITNSEELRARKELGKEISDVRMGRHRCSMLHMLLSHGLMCIHMHGACVIVYALPALV